jgi:hypothetical protein
MTHSLDRVGPERMSRRRVVLVFSAWILAVVGVLTVFVFAPTALHAYDRAHSQVIKCDVSRAEPSSVSVQSTNSSSTNLPRVSIKTKNCGEPTFERGVTDGNRDRIAAELDGRTCEFTVGAGSFRLRAFLGVLRVAPEVMSYEVVR